MGSDLFGDSTDWYSGQTNFRVIDIDIPGNNKLPVRIARTLSTAQYEGNPELMANWRLEVPYISGVYATSTPWRTDRCTGPKTSADVAPPRVANTPDPIEPWVTSDFPAYEYWRGISISIPGYGQKSMLLRDTSYAQKPADGVSYPWVAASNVHIGCLSTLANGVPGEGYVAVMPDGTRYYFNWLVNRTFPIVTHPNPNASPTGDDPLSFFLNRQETRIYATKVVDRFGNTVDYSYSGESLTQIASSDGRKITLAYNGNGYVSSISAGGRTWFYGYGSNYLSTVTLPDSSIWQLPNVHGLWIGYKPTYGGALCEFPPASAIASGTVTWTMTHPSGAVGTFTFNPRAYHRFDAPRGCGYDGIRTFPTVTQDVWAYALTGKNISGPSLSGDTWNVSYSAYSAIASTSTVTVTNPDSSQLQYTLGADFYYNEGKTLRERTFSSSGVVLQDVTYSYASSPTSSAYAYRIGSAGKISDEGTTYEDDFSSTIQTPTTSRAIVRDGVTFTRSTPAASFDAYLNPLSVARTSTAGFSKTDILTYNNNGALWVLGQPATKTDSSTGLIESQVDYDATTALPIAQYEFGLLMSKFTYNADGTLATVADGLSRKTALSNWKRGLPQSIEFDDSTSVSAVVTDLGWITSMTDENANTTIYGYDFMGRVSSIAYPSGDAVSWQPSSITYSRMTASEFGIPTGSWKRFENDGRYRATTYYDGRLRPILVQQLDSATGTAAFYRKRFDYENRVTYDAYPATTYLASSGVNASYDGLGRLTRRWTTGGVTLETDAYLSGNKKQVTDGDSDTTTISYQAFDEPSYERPTLILGEEGQSTSISRDVFGKIKTVTQYGNWSGGYSNAARQFYYDDYQRLCRRSDPESGDTVWSYDKASQISWMKKGQSDGTDCLAIAPLGVTRYTYDKRGRKTKDNYSGLSDYKSYDYDAAGNLTTLKTPDATWTYTYNKRNLVETEEAKIGLKTFTLDPGYDSLAHLTSLTTPTRTISYAPDAWGRPTQLGGYVTSVSYYPNGLPSAYSLGNGLSFSQTLDAQQRPYLQKTADGSDIIQQYRYTYSNMGDLTHIADEADDGADDLTATYDGLHRLKTATGIWGAYTYVYDTLNNLRSRSGPSALTYGYDSATNRLTTISGAESRAYDYNDRGDITNDGSHAFTVNDPGQITAIGLLGGTAKYGYDGNGRRIKTTKGLKVEYTLYDHSGRLVYSENSDAATDYLSLNGQALVQISDTGSAETVTYLHSNLLGSPHKSTDASGAIAWEEQYDPYGKKLNGVDEKIGYTGHVYDGETGFTYMQARFYDAEVGRFLSTDPVDFKDQEPFTFSRYSYAANNPYRYTDPFGMEAATVSCQMKCNDGGVSFSNLEEAATALSMIPGPIGETIATIQSTVDLINAVTAGDGKGAIFAAASLGASLALGGEGRLAVKSATTGAESAVNALKLTKALASEAQMAEAGTKIAGTGARGQFRDAERIAAEHGGDPADWGKMTSSSYTAHDGVTFETHWVENAKTGQRVEFKTKFPGND